MTTETMTVHQALIELKTLEKRIGKATLAPTFVHANRHGNTKINGKPVATIEEEIREAYQSCRDLIRRRNAIKSAVILSNATAKVRVDDRECTVAEAIDWKDAVTEFYADLIGKLASDLRQATTTADAKNAVLEDRANDYVRSLYGNADVKGISDEIRKVREEFVAAQTYELVDPIDITKEIAALTDWRDKLLVQIDSQLSVSNATTQITIAY